MWGTLNTASKIIEGKSFIDVRNEETNKYLQPSFCNFNKIN